MNTKDQSEINIGIDTGQAILDIHVRPQGHFQSFENNPEGIRAAIRFIKPFKPDRILIEATGRLEIVHPRCADLMPLSLDRERITGIMCDR